MRSVQSSPAFGGPLAVVSLPQATPQPTLAEKREWTISEMAQDFGLTLRALRFYESRGLIAPQRFGGARDYSARDRARVSLILAAKQLGFTLTETADMLGKTSEGEMTDLPLSLDTVTAQIGFLESQRTAIETALLALRQRLGQMTAASM